MKSGSSSTLPPFTVLFNGGQEFIIHKGYVFQANNGNKIPVTLNEEELMHGWKEEGSKIQIPSGSSVCVVITHGPKDEALVYEVVDLESATVQVGEPDALSTPVKAAVKIASVEYEEGSFSPLIDQVVNSDIYLAIFGENPPPSD